MSRYLESEVSGKKEMENRKRALQLDFLLAFGLVAYAVILLTINNIFDPTDHLGANIELAKQRFFWRELAEKVCTICGILYVCGNILMFCSAVKKQRFVSVADVCGYFVIQVSMMFLCVVPFGLFDFGFFGDYIFPIWSIAGALFCVLAIYSLYYIYKQKMRQR